MSTTPTTISLLGPPNRGIKQAKEKKTSFWYESRFNVRRLYLYYDIIHSRKYDSIGEWRARGSLCYSPGVQKAARKQLK